MVNHPHVDDRENDIRLEELPRRFICRIFRDFETVLKVWDCVNSPLLLCPLPLILSLDYYMIILICCSTPPPWWSHNLQTKIKLLQHLKDLFIKVANNSPTSIARSELFQNIITFTERPLKHQATSSTNVAIPLGCREAPRSWQQQALRAPWAECHRICFVKNELPPASYKSSLTLRFHHGQPRKSWDLTTTVSPRKLSHHSWPWSGPEMRVRICI